MPGFFPQAQPDELLYSVVARYGVLAGHQSGISTVKDVFGTSAGVAAVDLPRNLTGLLARLPPGHGLHADMLVSGHTLFPYLTKFAPAPFADRVREGMSGNAGRRPARIGVMSASFPARRHLLACPSCLRHDIATCGMGTWRRVHQLPGVLLCPEHGCPLRETAVERVYRTGRAVLAAATPAIVAAAARPDIPRAARPALLEIARAGSALLDGGLVTVNGSELQVRLRQILSGYRWSRAPSLLDVSALVRAFRRDRNVRHVAGVLCMSLTDGQLATAFNRLLHREQATKHPLFVALVLGLVGASLADLAPDASAPVPGHGMPRPPGPWHGLSPVPATTPGERDAGPANPASRVVPDLDGELRKLLPDNAVSLRAVGRQVGMSPQTVMRHARRLGLWRSEWKDRPKLGDRAHARTACLLAGHRTEWLRFRTTCPGTPAKRMPHPAFNAYRYLIRHDCAWIEQNFPLTRRKPGTTVDWVARDREWTERARLMFSPESRGGIRPRSRAELGRMLGGYSTVMRRMERLPILASLLEAEGFPTGVRFSR